MPKVAHYPYVAGVLLERRLAKPLARQLYEQLREKIWAGQLAPGSRVPSTRGLADQLNLARNTVADAYDQLAAEGYLVARVGSGTLVASVPAELRVIEKARRSAGVVPRISRRSNQLGNSRVRLLSVTGPPRAFASGFPDVGAFPWRSWARISARCWRSRSQELMTYGDPAGYRPLRAAVAAYLRGSRAVRCEPDQVFIVTGSQQALDLAGRVLIDPGDSVLLEDPGYPGARLAFTAHGASVAPLPVDEEGARIQGVHPKALKAQLAFVTPSHQFPLGVTMSIARRLQLLDWARHVDAWIIEDDYDAEFRYRGAPLASLQGLDTDGRVIHVGTFSKTVFPSLRLGFMVLPTALVEPFRRMRSIMDGHSSLVDQAVLAEFMESGEFSRHLRRMRKLYAGRQAALLQEAERRLGHRLHLRRAEGGLHVVGQLGKGMTEAAVVARAEQCGVLVSPLSACRLTSRGPTGILLGFAPFHEDAIERGVRRLRRALGAS